MLIDTSQTHLDAFMNSQYGEGTKPNDEQEVIEATELPTQLRNSIAAVGLPKLSTININSQAFEILSQKTLSPKIKVKKKTPSLFNNHRVSTSSDMLSKSVHSSDQ